MIISEADINDELLKPVIVPADLTYADNKMKEIAGRLGVTIGTTISQTAMDLAHAYACRRAAERKAGAVAPKVLDNGGIFDMYENKRRIYNDRITELAAIVSDADMTGGVSTTAGIRKATPFFMPISRG